MAKRDRIALDISVLIGRAFDLLRWTGLSIDDFIPIIPGLAELSPYIRERVGWEGPFNRLFTSDL